MFKFYIYFRNSEVPENVNIYEKILLPNKIPKLNSDIQNIRKSSEMLKNDFLPLHYGTSFEHKTHAIIKNIKFKLPKEYLNLSNKDKDDTIFSQNVKVFEESRENNNDGNNIEPQSEVTSVIVNPTNCQMLDTHWRKRTTHNFSTSHSESQF